MATNTWKISNPQAGDGDSEDVRAAFAAVFPSGTIITYLSTLTWTSDQDYTCEPFSFRSSEQTISILTEIKRIKRPDGKSTTWTLTIPAKDLTGQSVTVYGPSSLGGHVFSDGAIGTFTADASDSGDPFGE